MKSFLRLLLCIGLTGFVHTLYCQITNVNLSNSSGYDGEPYIGVNPANTNNIICAWMRMRPDGKVWIVTKSTFDAGVTWSDFNFLPHDTTINGSADVSLAFHRSGVAYLSYINFRTSPDTAGAVFVSRSVDSGLTWETPKKVIDLHDKSDQPIDRPWISVDNSKGVNDGMVYVTSKSTYWYQGPHHLYLRGSRDGGTTWSDIIQVDDFSFSIGTSKRAFGAMTVGGDGCLYIAYKSFDTSINPYVRYYLAKSYDAGMHFQRFVISNVIQFADTASDFSKAYTIAANPVDSTHVVFCWVDDRNGDSDILMKRSTDAGQTWSSVIRINDDSLSNGIAQDKVWMHYSDTGTLGVAWLDRRLNGKGTEVPSDVYSTISTDDGKTFLSNVKVTTTSSPYSHIAQGNSFIGVAMQNGAMVVDWADYRLGNWDIYYGKVSAQALGVKNFSWPSSDYALGQNYPNPFNPMTKIRYQLPMNSIVTLKIFDLLGREVETLVNGQQSAGSKEALWNASHVASGIYFYKLTAGNYSSIKKMVLLK